MKPKKSPKKEPVLKTDLTFEELIEGALNDKTFLPKKQKGFKKRNVQSLNGDVLDRNGKPVKK